MLWADSGAHASSSASACLRAGVPSDVVSSLTTLSRRRAIRHACHRLLLSSPSPHRLSFNSRQGRRMQCSASAESEDGGGPLHSAEDQHAEASSDPGSEGADDQSSTAHGDNAASTSSGGSNGSTAADAAPSHASSNSSDFSSSPEHGQRNPTPPTSAAASPDQQTGHGGGEPEWDRLDGNQLHTALSAAVNAEDYGRAQRACCSLVASRRFAAQVDMCPKRVQLRGSRICTPVGSRSGLGSYLNFLVVRASARDLPVCALSALVFRMHEICAGISDALRRRSGSAAGPTDWRQLGVSEWLADRAEQLGYRFPTGAATNLPLIPPGNSSSACCWHSEQGLAASVRSLSYA